MGGVGEGPYRVLTASGGELDYAESSRLMAADLSDIARARAIVLAGGPGQAAALAVTCRRFRRVTLVTDRTTGQRMLRL